MSKIFVNPVTALDGLLVEGMTILAYGGGGQAPHMLLASIGRSGVGNLTVIADGGGLHSLEALIKGGQVRRVIAPATDSNAVLTRSYQAGAINLELEDIAALDERLMAGKLAARSFLTRTGLGAPFAEGKSLERIAGELFIRETPLVADLAIVAAHSADEAGNLRLHGTASRSPLLVTAARRTVVEVVRMVPGGLSPAEIHVRGMHVDRLVAGDYRRYAPPALSEPSEITA